MNENEIFNLAIILLAAFSFLGVIGYFSFFIVKQQTAVIIERFGKFNSVRHAGLGVMIPFVDRISGTVSLKIRQLDVRVETKTNDDVFLILNVSVQYQILVNAIFSAFYKLSNSTDQITSYIFDTVRAQVPTMKLDDVFEKKDDIALAIKNELEASMREYGYKIVKALVTDIDPDKEVKLAMNRINASERLKVAAEFEAEADRIKIVAKARAEAESKKLQGQGIADQRREIARGLEESVEMLNQVGINPQEASSLIVITQHYDTLQSMGENANSNVILLPNSPSTASDMLSNLVASLTAADSINRVKR
ncbi:MAG: SPFH domain-containing protein [Cyclobacteriaceae bacterium]|nr:SPFH domain-containing protein [Cyclobacteriaceae bacterium]